MKPMRAVTAETRARLLAGVLCLAGAIPPGPAGAAEAPSVDAPAVTVYAARSVAEAVRRAGEAFREKTGTEVRVVAGIPADLAREIVRGGDADIFVPANPAAMTPLQKAGMVDPGAAFEWSRSGWVVVTAEGAAAPPESARDLAAARFRRIAFADAEAVPVGIHVQQAMAALGLWTTVRDRLVACETAGEVLDRVLSGGAELGIVPSSGLRGAKDVRVVELDSDSVEPLRYSAALVARPARPPAASRFLQFLRGPESRKILIDSGFEPAFP